MQEVEERTAGSYPWIRFSSGGPISLDPSLIFLYERVIKNVVYWWTVFWPTSSGSRRGGCQSSWCWGRRPGSAPWWPQSGSGSPAASSGPAPQSSPTAITKIARYILVLLFADFTKTSLNFRTQCTSVVDPDPAFDVNADPGFDDQKATTVKILQLKKIFYFFVWIAIYLFLGLHEGRPSYRSLQPSKENIQQFKTFLFCFCGSFLPSRIQI